MPRKSKANQPPTETKQERQPKQQYLPAAELWSRTIAQLRRDTLITGAQVESFLRPARLAIMELPSGKSMAAAIQTRSTFAANIIHDRWHAEIRACLQRLTGKQVILFVRNTRPPTMPPAGGEAA